MRVLAFAASLRRASHNKKLAAAAAAVARAAGAEVDLADFREFDMPLFDQDVFDATGLPPGGQELKRRLDAAGGLLLASPEYNFSLPGTLKNAIDWLSRVKPMPWHGKSALLLSTSVGAVGGVRGLWQLRIPLEGCGTFVYPDMFSLPKGPEAFDDAGALRDPKATERLTKLVAAWLRTTEALARQ
jgi:chromate reductase